MDLEAEVLELKRRMDAMEQEVTSQLTVLKHVYRVVNENRNDIIEMKGDINGMKGDINGMKRDISELQSDIREVKSDIGGLRKDLPVIVGDAVREAIRER